MVTLPTLLKQSIERLLMKFSLFSALLLVASFGFSPRALEATEGSRETIQWHLDYFIDTEVFNNANYQTVGGPWTRILDPARARIDNRLNRILQTTTEDGPGSVAYTLPKTLLPGEYPLEIVLDIGKAGDDPGEGGFPGGGKLHAFRAAGLVLPEHQVILQNGDAVIAWAEVTPEGSAVHLGGELDEFGSAINPTASAQGDGITIDNLEEGTFTRLVLRITEDSVALAYHSGQPEELFGPAYETTNFDGLDSDYIELACIEQAVDSAIDSVRFATNGGRTGLVGINTIAVFGHELSTGVGPFIRGDVNGDGALDIADASFVFNYLFLGGEGSTCVSAMNSNAEDGPPNLTAGVFLLNFLFMGGSAPPAPYPECGSSSLQIDLDLGCESSSACN